MMGWVKSFCMAMGMFTSIPFPYSQWDEKRAGSMFLCLPLVGLLIGGIWILLYWLAGAVRAPEILTLAVLAAAPHALSGCMHIDGFMDVTDAVMSRRETEEKLRILKDPHAGAFSVAGVVMLMLIQLGAAAGVGRHIIPALLLPAVSRALAGYIILTRASIPGSSFGAFFKDAAGKHDAALFAAFTAAAVIISALIDIRGAAGLAFAILVFFLAAGGARRQLSGVSGDVAGFSISICECAGLAALAII